MFLKQSNEWYVLLTNYFNEVNRELNSKKKKNVIELIDLYNSGTLAFGHNQDQLVQSFRARSNYGKKNQ